MVKDTIKLNAREQRYRKWNRLVLFIYISVTIAVLIRGFLTAYDRAVLYSVISLVMLALPKLAEKLGHFVVPADSRFLFYLFCFGAVELGSALDAYDWISWWDILLHGLSGALIALVGLLVYNGLRHNHGDLPKDEQKLAVLFMNLAATTSAALWEYYEFMLDTFFGFDAQYSAAGVGDTMTDMMICTVGGLCLSLWFYQSWRREKANFLMTTVAHFYACNKQERER